MSKSLFVTLLVAALIAAALGPAGSVVAQEGTQLTPGAPTPGMLTGNAVHYTINLTARQLLIANLESDAFDATLKLSDADGTALAYDDDSGSGTNAQLAFVAQTDGVYTLEVDGWSNSSGAFILTANVEVPAMVEIGGSTTLVATGDTPLYVAFAGSAGDVVNVAAATQGEDDLEMTLFGTDGQTIEKDDDDGPGKAPYLRRVVLPGDGLYLIKVEESFGNELMADVDVTVEATEVLRIDDTPQSVTLSDDGLGLEVYTFDVRTAMVYRIIVTSKLNTGVKLELLDTGDFIEPDFETGSALRITWDYQATQDGTLRLVVYPSSWSDGDEYTVAVEAVS